MQGVLSFIIILSGLVLPGWLLARVVPSPDRPLSAIFGSGMLLVYAVLFMDALGISITSGTTGGAVLASVAGLALYARFRPAPALLTTGQRLWPTGAEWWWAAPAVCGFLAIVLRATLSPLSGVDNSFRWGFLAEQMLRLHRLDFYPPVSNADYEQYSWSDGIPPWVQIMNLWSYVGAQRVAPLATAVRVGLEGLGLFYAVARLSQQLGGEKAAWPAAAAFSTTALGLWGVSMGQETGLTSLSLVSMVVFLEHYRSEPTRSTLWWAGLCAAAGALGREYGLAWSAFGLLVLASQGQLRRGAPAFLGTFILLAAPWYLRNFLRTGNPLFAQSLGGLFPVPVAHQQIMQVIRESFFTANPWALSSARAVFLASTTGMVTFLGGVGALVLGRRAWPMAATIMGIVLLWLWSIPQTAGGYSYSARVLAPATAILAAMAGCAIARLKPKVMPIAAIAVLALAVDTFARSFYLPFTLVGSVWSNSPKDWLGAGKFDPSEQERLFVDQVKQQAQSYGIIDDSPNRHAVFVRAGARVIALQSPLCEPMFTDSLTPAMIVESLRQHRIRFIVLSAQSESTRQLFLRRPFFQWLATQPPSYRNQQCLLYDVAQLSIATSTTGNAARN